MDLEKMKVELIADAKAAIKEIRQARKEIQDYNKAVEKKPNNSAAKKALDEIIAKVRAYRDEVIKINEQAKVEAGVLKPTKDYKNLQRQISNTAAALQKLKQKQAEVNPLTSKMTEPYAKLKAEYDEINNAFEKLINKERDMRDLGWDKNSDLWPDLEKKIADTAKRLGDFEAKMKELEIANQAYEPNAKWQLLQDEIQATTIKLEEYQAKDAQMRISGAAWNEPASPTRANAFFEGVEGGAIPDWVKKMAGFMRAIGETAGGARTGLEKIAAAAKEAFLRPVGWLKKLHSGFGKVLARIPLIGSESRKAKGCLDSFLGGFRGLLRIVKLFAFRRFLISAVKAIREGFSNLANYSSDVRNNLNMLKSSLVTLQNAFATAFAPILDIVAPILAKVIDWVSAAATAIAHLTAALTGKSTVVIARKSTAGITSGIADTGAAADKAKDSVDKYKRSLMGFDQINKLDDPSSGGSGSGGGGGGVGAGSMFDTVEVGTGYAGLAEKIKESWRNADFTEIGEMLGEKLNNALNSIPWDNIKETSRRIARSIATLLNGFLETADWNLVGKTVAEGINTGIGFCEAFVTEFHWDSLGKAIGDSISGTIRNIDWAALGKTIGEFLKGAFDTGSSSIANIDWKALGESLMTAIKNIDWGGVAASFFKLLGSALGGSVSFLSGVLNEIGDAIATGLKDGIWQALKNIGIWIVDNIVKPFIDGFKAAFGISSPSTVMMEQGGYLISGLLEGLKNKIGDIIEWFRNLPEAIRQTIGVIGINVTAKLSEWSDELKDKAVRFKARLTTWTDALKKKAVKFKAKLTKWRDALKRKTINFNAKIVSATLTSGAKAVLRAASIGLRADGGLYSNGSWKPITAAAGGGTFNQGQMFIAREAGPELVGTIGGHTAVMNNNQIVGSVSDGVYKAVVAAMSRAPRDNAVVVLEGDAAKFFKVIQKEAKNYVESTGRSPFPV